MSKKLPEMKTDSDAEMLLEQDLSDYISAGAFFPVRFEFQPKTEQINLRVSKPLLDTIKEQANKQGIGYQKYIRLLIEQSLTGRS